MPFSFSLPPPQMTSWIRPCWLINFLSQSVKLIVTFPTPFCGNFILVYAQRAKSNRNVTCCQNRESRHWRIEGTCYEKWGRICKKGVCKEILITEKWVWSFRLIYYLHSNAFNQKNCENKNWRATFLSWNSIITLLIHSEEIEEKKIF